MFLQDLYDSKTDEKYKKLATKLFKEYAVDVSIYESFGEAELTLFLEELEAKKNTIILESDYGDHVSNPEYTKTVLLSEAIRMFLREIAPKRLKRKVKKVDETLDYKVHSPTGASVDHDIDDDEERPDLYWRKHQWEEERSLANHPVEVVDAPPAGEAYVDDVSMAHNCDGEKMEPYADNAQPVGGTAENEQQAGVYVAVMNPDRFLGDKEVNVMAIEPEVKSENETSILTRKVKPAVIDVNDIDSYQNEFESEEKDKMTEKSMIEGLSELLDTSILEEGELQRAEMVFATNDVIIRLTKMIEDLSKIATEDVLGLVDGVRMNFGPEEAEQFSKMAELNIQSSADGIQKFKERLETYRDKFEARISDEDAHVPLETMAPEEGGEEMAPQPEVPPAVPDLTAPAAGEEDAGDELTDLLGGEDGKANEEPLGRAKKESRVVMVAGKRVRLSEDQIKSLWQARIITETIRRRVEGNPVETVTPEVITEKTTMVVVGGRKVRLSEEQFKALVFAKHFRKLTEAKGAKVVKLSEAQAKRLKLAKHVTERISKLLGEGKAKRDVEAIKKKKAEKDSKKANEVEEGCGKKHGKKK